MRLDVTFRHLSPREGIKERVEERASRLERFLEPSSSVALIFEATRGTVVAELLVSTRGDLVKATAQGHELRGLVDEVFHAIEHPLRRVKERHAELARRGGRTATQF